MGNLFLLITAAGLVGFGLLRGVDVFGAFLDGAREGLRAAAAVMPALTALTLAVSLVNASGFFDAVSQLLAPLIGAVRIPPQTLPLMLMRPVSGSGALAVVRSLMDGYGADSRVGRVAAVMMGSTETTFYTVAVYFGSVGVKKTGFTVPAALTADLTGMMVAALTVTLWMR